MTYAPIELCKKLQALGCKSSSGLFYTKYEDYPVHDRHSGIPAFHPWDLVANTEQARENAFIIWRHACICETEECRSCVNIERHYAIDAPDFWAYVERTMRT